MKSSMPISKHSLFDCNCMYTFICHGASRSSNAVPYDNGVSNCNCNSQVLTTPGTEGDSVEFVKSILDQHGLYIGGTNPSTSSFLFGQINNIIFRSHKKVPPVCSTWAFRANTDALAGGGPAGEMVSWQSVTEPNDNVYCNDAPDRVTIGTADTNGAPFTASTCKVRCAGIPSCVYSVYYTGDDSSANQCHWQQTCSHKIARVGHVHTWKIYRPPIVPSSHSECAQMWTKSESSYHQEMDAIHFYKPVGYCGTSAQVPVWIPMEPRTQYTLAVDIKADIEIPATNIYVRLDFARIEAYLHSQPNANRAPAESLPKYDANCCNPHYVSLSIHSVTRQWSRQHVTFWVPPEGIDPKPYVARGANQTYVYKVTASWEPSTWAQEKGTVWIKNFELFRSERPRISSATFQLANTASRLEIEGTHFQNSCSSLSVEFSAYLNNAFTAALSAPTLRLCLDKLLVLDIAIASATNLGTIIYARVTHATHGASNHTAVATVVAQPSLTSLATPAIVNTTAPLFSHASNVLMVAGANFYDRASLAHAQPAWSWTTVWRVSNLRIYLTTPTGASLISSGSVSDVVTSDEVGVGSQINFTVPSLGNQHAGPLRAIVSVRGIMTEESTIAEILPSLPTPSRAKFQVATSAAGNRIEITGNHFCLNPFNWTSCTQSVAVMFSPVLGVATTVHCNDTLVIVDVPNTNSQPVGDLYAVVHHTQRVCVDPLHCNSGPAVKVGSIEAATLSQPSITANTASLPSSASSLHIQGSNFGTNAAAIRVYLTPERGTHIIATVDASLSPVSSSSFYVVLKGMTDVNYGVLNAVVTVMGVKSAYVAVATVAAVIPVVNVGSFNIAQSQSGNLLEISGSRFGIDKSRIRVHFEPHLLDVNVELCTDSILHVSVGDTSTLEPQPVSATVYHTSTGTSNFGVKVTIGQIVPRREIPLVHHSTSVMYVTSTSTILVQGSHLSDTESDLRAYAFVDRTINLSLVSSASLHFSFDDYASPYISKIGAASVQAIPSNPAAVSLVQGRVGRYALYLNGEGYLTIKAPDSLHTKQYSVSAWLRTDTLAGWQVAVGHWGGSGASDGADVDWMHLSISPDHNFEYHSNVPTSMSPDGGIVPNTWYHVASVRSADKAELYLNGVLQTSVDYTSANSLSGPSPNRFYIGSASASTENAWRGAIDDIYMYGRALDNKEIAELSRQGGSSPSINMHTGSTINPNQFTVSTSGLAQLSVMTGGDSCFCCQSLDISPND